jgi:hypothetical protein
VAGIKVNRVCSGIGQPQSVTVYFEMVREGRLYETID